MTLLYCDIDGPLPPKLLPWITQCCRVWGWPIEAVRYDKTRRGWHVVVGVRKRLDFPMVVAAQAIFGSDPKREMFNMMRANAKDVDPFWLARRNVLYASHSRGITV